MKALNWIAWISGGIGLVFILIGLIQGLTGRFLPEVEIINYFHAANSFVLVTIALFAFLHLGQHKKE